MNNTSMREERKAKRTR